jgi:hypothetical protein
MNNLIMGSAFGYSIEKIKPFVLSLRQYYQGNVVFIVDSVSEEQQDFYNEYYIYTYIPDEQLTSATGNVRRFNHYQNCLEENFLDIENIFLTDVRDIVFQSDPFTNYPTYDIEFFAEPELLGNCNHNGTWYQRLYDNDGLEKVKDQYILCAGTTIGKRDTIVEYIKKLVTEVDRLSELGRAYGNCDQAIHNYLAYNGYFDNYRINQNGQGLVSTMHHSKILTFNRQGQMLNDDGTPTPVIHQYDRCGPMNIIFLKNALGKTGRDGIKTSADYAIENFFEHDLG